MAKPLTLLHSRAPLVRGLLFLRKLAVTEPDQHAKLSSSRGAGQLSDMGTWSPAYALSKTTLNGITCMLAAALKEKGVSVNSVCPGWCRTEMGGPTAPRSVEEGAAGIVWLAADAPQEKTGSFWRDKEIIPW